MDERILTENITKLSNIFGAHKAEWLGERLFDFYTTPGYFPLMTTSRPCVLVGGRGTGKTSVLRGLSYEGQYSLNQSDPSKIPQWSYYGFYYRVDTNRVSAFQGPELDEIRWSRHFGHYMNLLMCIQVLRFLHWYQQQTSIDSELDKATLEQIARAIHIETPENNSMLLEYLQKVLADFESNINNIDIKPRLLLSMQGAPVQHIFEGLRKKDQFKGKYFFFLIDEYENLLDYQQKLVNTLIKHSGELYTFKIGVREMGWRVRNTLNHNEQLIAPADYTRIDISQELSGTRFERFAYKICQDRLEDISPESLPKSIDIKDLLKELSVEEEVELLGIQSKIKPVIEELRDWDERNILESTSDLMIYLIDYWSRTQKLSLKELFDDYQMNPSKWKTRYENYYYALLFTIRNSGIRKYYCGWNTFVQLSGGNIRYLLQLVEESLRSHLLDDKSLLEPVSASTQTYSAHRVGRTNLTELEGLAVNGAKLTRLLLGLGRVFGVMASSPEGKAPETNQFEVVNTPDSLADPLEADQLIDASVMHLALIRWSGSKAADVTDTRAWDYMIHPIFSAFFNISYRRKRKFQLYGQDVLDLVNNPKPAIKRILSRINLEEDQLPEQLRLFGLFYND